ncbi:hypothetical protein AVEN_191072-1 [Araneus ventricosus]|uniref:Uncharacterized protein n=1 Tax=Araneus ventricosus TaxID=182803 RepID=A0A4Y2AYG5_ARAVE|nr:hypothetical protein AVEN_191072-1 [Araneus ventricosus]
MKSNPITYDRTIFITPIHADPECLGVLTSGYTSKLQSDNDTAMSTSSTWEDILEYDISEELEQMSEELVEKIVLAYPNAVNSTDVSNQAEYPPKTIQVLGDFHFEKVRALIQANHRLIVHEIAEDLGLNKRSFHKILTDNLRTSCCREIFVLAFE